jgi:hypothetical protein
VSYLIECIEHWRKGEPRLWWRPESKGYTWNVEEAGRYSEGEAASICTTIRSRDERMWPEADVLAGVLGPVTEYAWDGRTLKVVHAEVGRKDRFDRAWDVKAPGFDWQTVWAPTRGKAVHDQWKKAREAGYQIPWTDFRVRRSLYV